MLSVLVLEMLVGKRSRAGLYTGCRSALELSSASVRHCGSHHFSLTQEEMTHNMMRIQEGIGDDWSDDLALSCARKARIRESAETMALPAACELRPMAKQWPTPLRIKASITFGHSRWMAHRVVRSRISHPTISTISTGRLTAKPWPSSARSTRTMSFCCAIPVAHSRAAQFSSGNAPALMT
jgi:hypothetical protein